MASTSTESSSRSAPSRQTGRRRREFRIDATAEAIEVFAKTLGRADAVVLEATFHTWAIHSIFARFVDRVVVANPLQVRAIADAKIKAASRS